MVVVSTTRTPPTASYIAIATVNAASAAAAGDAAGTGAAIGFIYTRAIGFIYTAIIILIVMSIMATFWDSAAAQECRRLNRARRRHAAQECPRLSRGPVWAATAAAAARAPRMMASAAAPLPGRNHIFQAANHIVQPRQDFVNQGGPISRDIA